MKTYSEINVVGTHYRPPETIDTLLRIAESGEEIPAAFLREPTNEHDPNAVRVMLRHKTGLIFAGYVPAALVTSFWLFYRTAINQAPYWRATVSFGTDGQPRVKVTLTQPQPTPTPTP